MKKKIILFFIILLCVSVLIACNKDDAKIETELIFQKGFPTQIELFEGEEMNNNYIMYKGIVDFKNNNVVFLSSDENIVRVEVSSQEFPIYTYFDIIAASEGEAIIYAQNADGSVVSEPIQITVTKTPVQPTETELQTEIETESESTEYTDLEVNTEPVTTSETEARPEDIPETASSEENTGESYILNTDSKKFHRTTCSSAKRMKDENKAEFNGNRDELIAQGYSACKICKP